MYKPTLLRSRATTYPEGLIELTRDMIMEPVKQKNIANSGFEAIIENQQYLAFDGTDVTTTFGGYVETIADLSGETPSGVDDTRLVTDEMHIYEWDGASWNEGDAVKCHLYPSGLQAWTPLYMDINLGKTHNVSGIFGSWIKYPFNITTGYPNAVVYAGTSVEDLVQVGQFNANNALPANDQQIDFNEVKQIKYLRIAYTGTNNSININALPFVLGIIGSAQDGLRVQPRDYHFIPKGRRDDKRTFGEYLGGGYVRESSDTLLDDHATVYEYLRLFAVDCKLFTGEECITGTSGNIITVNTALADIYPNDKIGFNPARGAADYDFDTMFDKMNTKGYKTIAVLARGIPYLHLDGSNQVNAWQKPYANGGDPANPLDYGAISSLMFQFAARYGSNSSIDDSLITPKLFTGNTVKKGLGTCWAIGLGNESDKDWITEEELMRPKEMAAYLSACIDGHMGLMGDGHGAWNADPNIHLFMNGLIESKTDYIKMVIFELMALRKDAPKYGYEINPLNNSNVHLDVHQYPVKGVGQNSAVGGSPVEETDFLENANRISRELKYYCPNAKIPITETGLDSTAYYPDSETSTSRVATPMTPSETRDADDQNYESQAKHLCRLAMYGYIGGYDQMYIFTLKDPYAVGAGGFKTTFAMSGLYQKSGDTKKVSWYAINTLRKRLLDYTYVWHSINEANGLHIVKLADGTNEAYVVWKGTNNDESISNYVLDIGTKTTANRIDYSDGVALGNSSSMTVTDNTVTFNVIEKPVIILTS